MAFVSAGSQPSVVSSHISMPNISASIGSEENRLLQNEVETLTRDMHALSGRLQSTQEGDRSLHLYRVLTVRVSQGILRESGKVRENREGQGKVREF